jgi:hypothetical protein
VAVALCAGQREQCATVAGNRVCAQTTIDGCNLVTHIKLAETIIVEPQLNLPSIASEDSKRQCRAIPLLTCSICSVLTDYVVDQSNRASGCVVLDVSSCNPNARPVTLRCFSDIDLNSCGMLDARCSMLDAAQ